MFTSCSFRAADDDQTEVTWTMVSRNDNAEYAATILPGLQAMISDRAETGLRVLKSVLEKG